MEFWNIITICPTTIKLIASSNLLTKIFTNFELPLKTLNEPPNFRVSDCSGNPFLRHEKKIATKSATLAVTPKKINVSV